MHIKIQEEKKKKNTKTCDLVPEGHVTGMEEQTKSGKSVTNEQFKQSKRYRCSAAHLRIPGVGGTHLAQFHRNDSTCRPKYDNLACSMCFIGRNFIRFEILKSSQVTTEHTKVEIVAELRSKQSKSTRYTQRKCVRETPLCQHTRCMFLMLPVSR